jgi:hypothetical protein
MGTIIAPHGWFYGFLQWITKGATELPQPPRRPTKRSEGVSHPSIGAQRAIAMTDMDDDTRHRIAMFEAAIAAYVAESLNPQRQPELSYDTEKNTILVFSHLRGEIPLVTGNALLAAVDPQGPHKEVPVAVPHDPEVVYDVVARTYLRQYSGADFITFCRRLAEAMQSFWPSFDAERLAEKMKVAADDERALIS